METPNGFIETIAHGKRNMEEFFTCCRWSLQHSLDLLEQNHRRLCDFDRQNRWVSSSGLMWKTFHRLRKVKPFHHHPRPRVIPGHGSSSPGDGFGMLNAYQILNHRNISLIFFSVQTCFVRLSSFFLGWIKNIEWSCNIYIYDYQ